MLSFDFLNDEVVYGLAPVQVMLLSGMIARADNLGRLPGAAGVLLGFLFYPKDPRTDVMPTEVEGLLMALARSKRVAWYAVEGVRFVQFLRWDKNQPGIREHNRKSSFPGPETPGAVAVVIPGETLEMFDASAPAGRDCEPPSTAQVRRQSVEQRGTLAFDSKRVGDWVLAHSDGPELMSVKDWIKFSAWLWNSGTKSMPVLLAMLDECAARRPNQPYAYFKDGTETREAINMRVAARVEEARHEKIKVEEKAFATKGGVR